MVGEPARGGEREEQEGEQHPLFLAVQRAHEAQMRHAGDQGAAGVDWQAGQLRRSGAHLGQAREVHGGRQCQVGSEELAGVVDDRGGQPVLQFVREAELVGAVAPLQHVLVQRQAQHQDDGFGDAGEPAAEQPQHDGREDHDLPDPVRGDRGRDLVAAPRIAEGDQHHTETGQGQDPGRVAEAVGARTVRFDSAGYRIDCPQRLSPATATRAEDGHPLVVRASLTLRGGAPRQPWATGARAGSAFPLRLERVERAPGLRSACGHGPAQRLRHGFARDLRGRCG